MANQLDEIVDFRRFLFKIIENWFLLTMSLLLAFSIAFSYNRYAISLFNSETSILIKEENSFPTASDLLYDKVTYKHKSIENKSLLLKSYPLIYNSLKDLGFDISYFIEGLRFITS